MSMVLKQSFMPVAALACAALSATAATAGVVEGPTSMSFQTANWGGSGMVIVALRDVSLSSLTFWSQGKADTLELLDLSGNVLESQSVAAGGTVGTVNLDWTLAAGQTYRLMQTTRDNSQWTISPPEANDDLSVTTPGVFFNRANSGSGYEVFPSIWVAFTHLVTEDVPTVPTPAPEPASWAMMLAGFAAVGGALRRRNRVTVSFG